MDAFPHVQATRASGDTMGTDGAVGGGAASITSSFANWSVAAR